MESHPLPMDNVSNSCESWSHIGQKVNVDDREKAEQMNDLKSDRIVKVNKSPTSSRHIRFHETPEVLEYLPTSEEMPLSEKKLLWWDVQDFESFQCKAKRISREVRRNRRMTIGIDEAYMRAEALAEIADEAELEEEFSAISINEGLAIWCAHGDSRRGLERWGSRLHNSSRSAVASKVKSDVTRLQLLSPEELQAEAEKRSRVARIFARMMGEADAIAAHFQNLPRLRRWSALATSVPITAGSSNQSKCQRAASIPAPRLPHTTL